MISPSDLVNDWKSELSIEPDLYSNTKSGSAIDMQDTGADVFAFLHVGMIGADSSLAVKLQESATGTGSWSDISGATFTTVSTASANNRSSEVIRAPNRTKRYVRAVGTMTGSSPDIDYSVLLMAQKHSY